MHPLTLRVGLLSSTFITVIAPKLCAYKNSGKSDLAYPSNLMTSLANISTVPHPLGPPE